MGRERGRERDGMGGKGGTHLPTPKERDSE